MTAEPFEVQIDHDEANSDAPLYSLTDTDDTSIAVPDKQSQNPGATGHVDAGLEDEVLEYKRFRTCPTSVKGYGLEIVVTPPPNDNRYMIGDWTFKARKGILYLLPSLDVEHGQDIEFDKSLLRPPFRMFGTGGLADKANAGELLREPHMYFQDWMDASRRNLAITEKKRWDKAIEAEFEALQALGRVILSARS